LLYRVENLRSALGTSAGCGQIETFSIWYTRIEGKNGCTRLGVAEMGAVVVEISPDLAEPLAEQAEALNVDVSRFIAAVRIPLKIGDLEVYAPADVLEYEMERAPDETDSEHDAAKATYGRLFGAATR
jgi:hypothetical protein